MSLSFSRSMRSLQSDSFRPSLVTLIIASILVVAWFVWLAFASITLYESSGDWELQRDGTLVVRFPQQVMPRLQPGQRATLEIHLNPNQPPAQMRAMVADIPSRTQNHLPPNTVKVALLSGPMPKGVTNGEIKVAVESVSPLTLITRAASQLAAR